MFKRNIAISILLGLFPAFLPAYAAMSDSLTTQISLGNDDAREIVSSGANKTTSGSLDLGVNADPSKGPQYVAFRFSGLGIPQGADITAAYIQFTSYAGSTNASSLTIKAQAADHSPSFSGLDYDISSRPTTTASVAWNPPDWLGANLVGDDQRTPDLTSIVNEVVNRPGWASGNSMVFIFSGSGTRLVCSQDSSPTKTASLHVEWRSSFVIRTIEVKTGNEVGWQGPTNDGITFTIYRATNLPSGVWELLATNIEKSVTGTNAWTDLNPPPGSDYVFYRVGKRTPPPVNRTIAVSGVGTNGYITPSGDVTVPNGSNITFSIVANTGYHIEDVLVDGVSVGAVNSYLFVNVVTNHTISASFSVNIGTNYTITANAGTNGSITPSGDVIVPLGSNANFTVTAASGYDISSVIVDGTSVGAVSSYQFNNVSANHTINASFVAEGQQISSAPDPTILLIADEGANSGPVYHSDEHWTTGWGVGGSVSWSVTTSEADDYAAIIVYCCDPGSEGSGYRIACGGSAIDGTVRTTAGWLDNWRNFERIPVSGTFHIPSGTSTVTLSLTSRAGGVDAMYFHTIYLIPQSAQKQADLAAVSARALAQRSSRTWFKDAKYGVWFHWVDESTPQSGPRADFTTAVNAFNVPNFVSMIEQTGAGYVVWSAAHRNQYWPAPIQAVENVLPGHTTSRDLIGELCDALNAKGIKLMLYHIPSFPASGWPQFYDIYSNVLTEASVRYGSRLSGWWLDFGMQKAPFEGLTKACKAGNANSLVAWSPWVYPKLTDFQDYYAGEFGSTLVVPTANYPNYFSTGGPQDGLQAHGVSWIDDPWWHITLNTPIASPIFSADQISAWIQTASSKDQVVTICLGIYQDGTIGPASLSVMQNVRIAIRGH